VIGAVQDTLVYLGLATIYMVVRFVFLRIEAESMADNFPTEIDE
jgi:hypothetical protein